MAIIIPTTQELFESILATLESATSQTAPTVPKAFKRAIAKAISAVGTLLYKYSNDRIKQVLALTAGLEGLKKLGAEQAPQITYKNATRADLTLELTCSIAGETISTSTAFVSDDTGIRYRPITSVVTTTPTTDVEVRCDTAGTDGNLNVSDTLTLSQSISGVNSTCDVTSLDVEAIDDENLEVFRSRVLTAMRAIPGFGNAYDYKRWAETVTGVEKAFPYSGKPGGDEDVTAFLDGNAENVGVADWTAENSATLTKNASIKHGGSQSLQVARNGVNDPMASQACLTQYQYYNIQGYAYSDGNAIPVICDSDTKTNVYWRGTNNSAWQEFDINFRAEEVDLMFCAETSTGTEYVLFDDIDLNVSFPGDRTVYVKASTSVDADGIAPQWLLDDVREALLQDPITGLSRMGLVDTDDRLYIESISRTLIYIQISGLECKSELESEIKTKLQTALEEYIRDGVQAFIIGVDSELDRNDILTKSTLSLIAQGVLFSYGATITDIDFDLDGTFTSPLVSYRSDFGELFDMYTPISYV